MEKDENGIPVLPEGYRWYVEPVTQYVSVQLQRQFFGNWTRVDGRYITLDITDDSAEIHREVMKVTGELTEALLADLARQAEEAKQEAIKKQETKVKALKVNRYMSEYWGEGKGK